MFSQRQRHMLYALCLAAFILNAGVWFSVRNVRAAWLNIPPVPSEQGAVALALGDKQFAFRLLALTLQNLGSAGGRFMPLGDYDYQQLGKWFQLAQDLDPVSDFVPLLAAYYFGGTEEVEDLDPVIDYLARVGATAEGEKWRWLAHAIYLARFKQQDRDKALNLAYILAGLENENMPVWTRQMPAFILAEKGDREAAYELLINLLKDKAGNLHPNEVNFTRYYICEKVLDRQMARINPLCQE